MTTPIQKVLLVGHCGADSGSLTRLVKTAMGLPAVRINSDADLSKAADASTLLLINRVLDGYFDAQDGVELVEQLAGQENASPMMVITNYPEVQTKAQEAGALPGFGKNDIGSSSLSTRLSALVKSQSPAS